MIDKHNWVVKYPNVNNELDLVSRILDARGISKEELEKREYHDTALMNDMANAIERIKTAIEKHESIVIYGDYDVDGIMATTIMVRGLNDLGANVSYFIPNRFSQGYGFSKSTINEVIAMNPDLIISVDCGITAGEFMSEFEDFMIDVIITDHHEPLGDIPNAIAVIDCKRKDNSYPFRELCGAGVAYKLITHLAKKMGKEINSEPLLQNATIATIADVVPLINENRTIVADGLDSIHTNASKAIKYLVSATGKNFDLTQLKSENISFYIAPLINAASRMGQLNVAMDMMLSNDIAVIQKRSAELFDLNQKRKQIEKAITEAANANILTNHNFCTSNAIVVAGTNWHWGVIGIVASKLVDIYNRPAIVLTTDDGVVYHGSCRSYGDINIMDLLSNAKKYILNYGGHAGAAGLTVLAENLEAFKGCVNKYMENISKDMLTPTYEAEMVIQPEDITLENVEQIEQLQPFGEGNSVPLFICKNLKVKMVKRIGKDPESLNAHLKLSLFPKDDPSITLDAIAFYGGDYADALANMQSVNVMFSLNINEWKDNRTVQLMVKEIRFRQTFPELAGIEQSQLYEEQLVDIETLAEMGETSPEELLPTRDEYINIARELNKLLTSPKNDFFVTTLGLLTTVLSTRTNTLLTPFKVSRVLATCNEGGFLEYRRDNLDKIYVSKTLGNKEQKKLSQTNEYIKDHSFSNM